MSTTMGLLDAETRDARQREFRRAVQNVLLEAQVPASLHYGLTEYVVARQQPGAFLMAVLTNDLADAAVRADHVNRVHLYQIVMFLHRVSAVCWGSPEKVAAWLLDPDPPDFILD